VGIQKDLIINNLGATVTQLKLEVMALKEGGIMQFWQIAFMYRWVTADQLKLAVKTETNPFGEISKEQYKEITGQEFKAQAKA